MPGRASQNGSHVADGNLFETVARGPHARPSVLVSPWAGSRPCGGSSRGGRSSRAARAVSLVSDAPRPSGPGASQEYLQLVEDRWIVDPQRVSGIIQGDESRVRPEGRPVAPASVGRIPVATTMDNQYRNPNSGRRVPGDGGLEDGRPDQLEVPVEVGGPLALPAALVREAIPPAGVVDKQAAKETKVGPPNWAGSRAASVARASSTRA